MTANLLDVYSSRPTDRVMVQHFFVCCNGFEIKVVLTVQTVS
jgi:hypothetical protein